MIVIDASGLTAYLLGERPELEEYFYEELISIDLIAKEVSNALINAYREKRIDSRTLEKLERVLLRFIEVIELQSQMKFLSAAFQLALNSKLTIYDALYIVLAKKTDASLLSLDSKQRKVAKGEGVEIIPP